MRKRIVFVLTARLVAILSFTALLCGPSPALAQLLGDAEGFGLLAGSAVTCTNSTVTGDLGVDSSTGFITQTTCPVTGTGTVYSPGDPAAQAAYDDFLDAYTTLNSTTCDETLTGTLAGVPLTPGVYCVDAVAKTGTLTLDAEGDANAQFIFLVAGALTGTNFNVVMTNGGDLCNVYWQTDGATTLTTSNVVGTVLSGAAITVTGGTFDGGLLATDAATLTTGSVVDACVTSGPPPPPPDGDDHCKDKNKGHGHGKDKDKGHGHCKDKDKGHDHGKDKDKGHGHGKDKDKGHGHGKDKDKGHGHGKDKEDK
jgi:hypothetical protein